jgi:Protein of unknown function (DUF4197)
MRFSGAPPPVLITLLAGSLLLLAAAPAGAQLDKLLKELPQIPQVPQTGAVGDAKIGAALKEALQVGTSNAVQLTGRPNGYFSNQAIKILMPENLRTLEKGLRTVGYGPQVDELVLGMNRSAEKAAPAAKQIFLDAIGAMTFDDVNRIFRGSNTAATDYFKAKTSDKLTTAFRPVVEQSMNEVGVARQYKELLGRAQSIPFVKTESYDINQYVVTKSLDGLFYVVGDEERKIRTNPAARTTDLLREVFGK